MMCSEPEAMSQGGVYATLSIIAACADNALALITIQPAWRRDAASVFRACGSAG